MPAEWWVCRVLARPAAGVDAELAHTRVAGELDAAVAERWWCPEEDRPPTVTEWRQLSHLAETGAVQRMPDGAVVEPIEGFTQESEAHAWFERARASFPRQEFRVVLTQVIDENGAPS